ncbi:MAG: hypothetical protein U9R75_08675 [Candidatus Thermoplasmatota archaeon]|nr:hypothetical protein [Candidatus Thermoplasmatota archaeon]
MVVVLSLFATCPSSGQELVDIDTVPIYYLPSNITVGEEMEIDVLWEGSVLVEVLYPGMEITWILEPKEDNSNPSIFELPALYADGEILIWLHYSPSLDIYEMNLSVSEQSSISVIGWIDLDGDGMEDTWEDRYNMEGREPDDDKDGDKLSNILEMYALSNPGKRDSDGDEMKDLWEFENGTLPFDHDAYGDPDLDEWSNIKEMVKGTDPRDPTDHPDEPPVTPWYWIVLILVVLLLILGYFVKQLFNKKKFDDDMEEFDRRNSLRGRK